MRHFDFLVGVSIFLATILLSLWIMSFDGERENKLILERVHEVVK